MDSIEAACLAMAASDRREKPRMSDFRFQTKVFALIAAAIVFGSMIREAGNLGEGDRSRWATIWALTHSQGYIIDEAPFDTHDKVWRDPHFYSSKPAALPTLLAGIALPLKWLGFSIPEQKYFVIGTILLLLNVIPLAVMIVFYGRIIERLVTGSAARVYCLAAASFGTYLTAYSIALNNHTVAAIAAFLALYAFVRIYYDGSRDWRHFAVCGLMAAWTFANELPAGLFVFLIAIALLARAPKQTLSIFAPSAAIVFAFYLVTNILSTGSVLPYQLISILDWERAAELWHYEGSYWSNPSRIDAQNDPWPAYLYNLTLGHHGFFSLTPVLALGLWGMIAGKRLPAVNRAGLLLTIVLLALYTKISSNYGGGTQGPRWLFWVIPFWLIGLAEIADKIFESRLTRYLAYAALGVSVMSVAYALGGPWKSSWLYWWGL